MWTNGGQMNSIWLYFKLAFVGVPGITHQTERWSHYCNDYTKVHQIYASRIGIRGQKKNYILTAQIPFSNWLSVSNPLIRALHGIITVALRFSFFTRLATSQIVRLRTTVLAGNPLLSADPITSSICSTVKRSTAQDEPSIQRALGLLRAVSFAVISLERACT